MSAFQKVFDCIALLTVFLILSGSATKGDESARVLVFSNRKVYFHATESNSRQEMSTFDLYKIIQESIGFGGYTTYTGQNEIEVNAPIIADVFENAKIQGLIHIEGDLSDILGRVQSVLSQQNLDVFCETYALKNTEYNRRINEELIKGASHQDGFYCSEDGNVQICDESGTEMAIGNERVRNKRSEVRNVYGEEWGQEDQLAKELVQIEDIVSLPTMKRLFFMQISGLKSLNPEVRESASQIIVEALAAILVKFAQESNVINIYITTGQVEVSHQKGERMAFARRNLLTFDDLAGSSSGNASSHQNQTTSEITLEEIANFQIVLWTAIILAFILFGIIGAMLNLSTSRDSLLHVKFVANASHRKTD
ncbi:unnamed protein product [Albugo candida]|uniref:Uncharacterized protein n=1 Tax=Albugo candida TaxID=65357 RepID=A0A024GKE0_9STRA|nr:unnamed protein product [Albugo candida]|eukprot:CCI47199.1 unnamed protein product [Albugo candida]